MKLFLISVIIAQILYFPVYVAFYKRGFFYYNLPSFKMYFQAIVGVCLFMYIEKTYISMAFLFIYLALVFGDLFYTTYLSDACNWIEDKFIKDNSTGSITHLGSMSLFDNHKWQMMADVANFKVLIGHLVKFESIFPDDWADIVCKAVGKNMKFYEFLRPGFYGEDIIKAVCITSLLILA